MLRARGHAGAALTFGRALLDGVHRLEVPTDGELTLALDLTERYSAFGVDLPDAIVMAMAAKREASVLTWDFRHFRSVVLEKGQDLVAARRGNRAAESSCRLREP